MLHSERRREYTFSRRFRLSEGLDREHVSATLQNGVLTLVIPKLPKKTPQKIVVPINGGAGKHRLEPWK